jgi:hypothetical protein
LHKRCNHFWRALGALLAPHIRSVLNADDDVWKNWVLRYIVVKSPELQTMLGADIERLATRPTRGEQAEELDVLAGQIVG